MSSFPNFSRDPQRVGCPKTMSCHPCHAPHLAEQIREDDIPWLRPCFSPFFGCETPGGRRLTPQRRMDVQLGVWSLKVPRFWEVSMSVFFWKTKTKWPCWALLGSVIRRPNQFSHAAEMPKKFDQPLSSRELTHPTNWKGNIFFTNHCGRGHVTYQNGKCSTAGMSS